MHDSLTQAQEPTITLAPDTMQVQKAAAEPTHVIRMNAKPWAEWIIRRELLWLALLSPFFLFPNRAIMLLCLAALLVLWSARHLALGYFVPPTALDWPIALLVAMLPVSLFATFSVDYSLPKVSGLLFGVALYYAIVQWSSSNQRLHRVVELLVVGGGLILALFGLVGTNWMAKWPAFDNLTALLPQLIRGLPGAENGLH